MSVSSLPTVHTICHISNSVSELTVGTKFIAIWKYQRSNWLLQKYKDKIDCDTKM